MLAFLARRLIGAVLVLIAVSFIIYLIFIMIPGGDPAERIAGKNGDRRKHRRTSAQKLHLDRPLLRAVLGNDAVALRWEPQVLCEPAERRERDQAGDSGDVLAPIGAGIIWLIFGILVGVISAVTAGGRPIGSSRCSR